MIGTTEGLKRTLLDAKSIAYLEGGLTGTYLKVLFQRLGIADDMKPKYKNARGVFLLTRCSAGDEGKRPGTARLRSEDANIRAE